MEQNMLIHKEVQDCLLLELLGSSLSVQNSQI